MTELPFDTNEPFLAYYCGEPRSGKSYLSAYTIEYALQNHDYNIFTDLQGLEADDNRIKRFSKQDFLVLWTEEMSANLSETYGANHDVIFREKFKEKGLLHALIVLDEVQEFLDVEIKVWKRIFSYYGHYDMKLILITQDLELVHLRYKSTPDKFLWAVSSGNRAGKNDFSYKWFNNAKMRDDGYRSDLVTDFKIPKLKEVFQSYNSGSKVAKKSNLPLILKSSILPLVMMFICGLFLYWYIAPESKEVPKEVSTKQVADPIKTIKKDRPVQNSIVSNDMEIISMRYVQLNDVVSDLYFQDCPTIKIPFAFFVNSKFSYFRSSNSFLFLVPPKISTSLKGLCNEKNNNNDSVSMFK